MDAYRRTMPSLGGSWSTWLCMMLWREGGVKSNEERMFFRRPAMPVWLISSMERSISHWHSSFT